MADEQPIRIPVYDGDLIRAYALVDPVDAALASHRWSWFGKGYAAVNGLLMHRVILGLSPNDGFEADHVDRDKMNNRRANLRAIPKGKNQQNTRSRRGSTSQYRGVSWNTRDQRWIAQACLNGHRFYLGQSKSEVEAAEMARAFRAEHMPYAID